jgi:hypothetical protein
LEGRAKPFESLISQPGSNVIKLFMSVLFLVGLMFMVKASSLTESGVSFRCSNRIGSGPNRKHKTRLERLIREKRSSILRKFVNYGCKKFITLGPGLYVLKLFTAVIYEYLL